LQPVPITDFLHFRTVTFYMFSPWKLRVRRVDSGSLNALVKIF